MAGPLLSGNRPADFATRERESRGRIFAPFRRDQVRLDGGIPDTTQSTEHGHAAALPNVIGSRIRISLTASAVSPTARRLVMFVSRCFAFRTSNIQCINAGGLAPIEINLGDVVDPNPVGDVEHARADILPSTRFPVGSLRLGNGEAGQSNLPSAFLVRICYDPRTSPGGWERARTSSQRCGSTMTVPTLPPRSTSLWAAAVSYNGKRAATDRIRAGDAVHAAISD